MPRRTRSRTSVRPAPSTDGEAHVQRSRSRDPSTPRRPVRHSRGMLRTPSDPRLPRRLRRRPTRAAWRNRCDALACDARRRPRPRAVRSSTVSRSVGSWRSARGARLVALDSWREARTSRHHPSTIRHDDEIIRHDDEIIRHDDEITCLRFVKFRVHSQFMKILMKFL